MSEQQTPMRFTLRELFVLTALVCAFGASWSWAATSPEESPLVPITFLPVLAYLTHILTRWSLVKIALGLSPLLAFLCLWPAVSTPRTAASRSICSNNQKQIALALQNYHDVFATFPPAYIADQDGRPMHSWRVLLLPFLEQKSLYQRYDFSEPWNGPNNRKLHNEIMHVFCCPSRPARQPRTETSYVVVVGPQTAWPGTKAAKLGDLTDGTSNTLMLVEIANSGIHWMEPRDLNFSQMPMQVNPPKGQGISSYHPNVAIGAFADGHTQPMSSNTPPKIIRALLTAQGGDPLGDY